MHTGSLTGPRKFDTLREVFAPIEWFSTCLQAVSFSLLPRGDGRPIVLSPGYLTNELSMRPMKIFLQRLGYQVFDWGLGKNRGKVDEDIERLAQQLADYQEQHAIDEPFTLIGWSLGGVISREVARLYPQQVREVITLGSPITGGAKYTVVAGRYARREKLDLNDFEQHVLERNKLGIRQPVTSIYSRRDGVVGWQASLDVYNPQARNIEVKGSHLALGVNASAWRIIAHVLAESADAGAKRRAMADSSPH